MKISKAIDKAVMNALESEHEKALNQLLYHNKEFSNILPMHTANMNIMINESTGECAIRPVIIPEIAIYIDAMGIRDDADKRYKGISRDKIEYHIVSNNASFPLSHVYSHSGYLCLGNIFVPPYVPLHSPQQPLETLFLHNDRNYHHGGPELMVTQSMVSDIKMILLYSLPKSSYKKIPIELIPGNWVINDKIWHLSAWILTSLPKDMAFNLMQKIYNIVFPNKKTK